MAGAGAAMKAFLVITRTQLGFDPEHVVAMNVSSPAGSTTTWRQRANIQEQARQAVARVPGVVAASVSTSWFPPFGGFDAAVEVNAMPTLSNAHAVLCLASPQILDALRMPLISGRNFRRWRSVSGGARRVGEPVVRKAVSWRSQSHRQPRAQ
jgi:hypothetical protein